MATFQIPGAAMEGLETTYEDSNAEDFIECAVCTRSIRGDTLYKIHLTTILHIRKEDTLVSTGRATRDHELPHFTDIKHYLQYLNLDEPIIGLGALEEVEPVSHDRQPGPRYICRLCDLEASLPNMVNHLIGRRHRQNYMDLERKDLVTWDSTNVLAQSGKAIRAIAEIAERQDGPGIPKPLKKKENVDKLNISRVPPKERGAKNQPKQTLSHPSDMRREGHLHPGRMDFPDGEYHHRGGHPEDDLYRPPFHEDDPYLLSGAVREVYLRGGDPRLRGFEEDELRRAGYHEDDLRRREFMEDDLRRRDHYLEEQIHGQDYLEDMRRREFLEEGVTRPGHHKEIPHRQAYPEEPPRRSVYPENDPLKQFYSDEVLRRTFHAAEASKERTFREDESPRGRSYPHYPAYPHEFPPERAYPDKAPLCFEHAHGRAAHRPSVYEDPYSEDPRRSGYLEEAQRRTYPEEQHGPAYPEGIPHMRSLDRDPNGRGYPKGPDGQGAADKDWRFTDQMKEPMETGAQSSREHLFDLVKAIRQEGRDPQNPETERGMGPPGMTGTPQRPAEGGRVRTEIPEPFRRFLEGATDDHKSPGKRKRKSRFSDATEQERDVVKKMQTDDSRRRSEPFSKPQGAYQGVAGSRPMAEATPDTGNVLDVLNNIQVENVEEANFLKDKLCYVLKEFQDKKSDKTAVMPAYKSLHPTVISKDYNHMSNDHLESPRDNYERNYREVQEERHYEGHPPRHSQERYIPETLQDPYRGKHRDTDQRMERRAQYEEVFGHVEMYPHARPEEPMAYPHERCQGPMYPRDYPPAEDLYNPFNPTTPIHWERGYRMGGPQSTSLDKITSTLLELVARKK
uniref:C2H2-type domain-containing protein n=1 Tax=Hucho hucho TaxID=62062 RepID=A0A4W5KTK1_9TELE